MLLGPFLLAKRRERVCSWWFQVFWPNVDLPNVDSPNDFLPKVSWPIVTMWQEKETSSSLLFRVRVNKIWPTDDFRSIVIRSSDAEPSWQVGVGRLSTVFDQIFSLLLLLPLQVRLEETVSGLRTSLEPDSCRRFSLKYLAAIKAKV